MPDDVRMQRRDQRGDEPDARRPQPRADLEDDERGRDGDDDLRDPDREPRAAEREVERGEEPAVERLRVRRGDVREEAERPVVDERLREAVALVDELLEDRLTLADEDEQARESRPPPRRRERPSTVSSSFDHDGRHGFGNGTRSCPATLSDRSTTLCGCASRPCRRRRPAASRDRGAHAPGGLRPSARTRTSGRERAREAPAARAPARAPHALDGARPRAAGATVPCSDGTGERVVAEAARLRELGSAPTLFCGGGWYTDLEVAEACAELGYVDCTPRATRPPYLGRRALGVSRAPSRVRAALGPHTWRDPDDAHARRSRRALWRAGSSRARARLLPRHGSPRPAPARAAPRHAAAARAARAGDGPRRACGATLRRAPRAVGRRGAALSFPHVRQGRSAGGDVA